MKRRSVLVASALAVPLAACNLSAQTVESDAQLIATRLSAFVPVLAAIPGVPAADVALVQKLSADVQQAATLAGTLYTNIAPAVAAPTIKNIEAAITGALGIATAPPVSTLLATAAPGLSVALQAASVLVPLLFASFGLPAPVSATPVGMTPAQARAILAAGP
jgi:hypothetical protein